MVMTSRQDKEKAEKIAVAMLKHGKSFSETYHHIEKVFCVNTSEVMSDSIDKYRKLFI